ncbi:RES family NAD+ phosphorylase [Flavobacterium sp.]|uniref:RES family NAD+ phosphorylase n=1 Tax=Flavobacterium sp. TaxID=239 RepID=UPI002487F2B9|nr:RES family NAD+ phosphorylase [Flavobacterium sp.]MDI1318283.1 RES family NAD+ phosphorylase [Flavobacterium sp.]
MEVFRLQNSKYPLELSGKGAATFGARWNSKGTEIIYTAHGRCLAMAEVVVHLSLAMLPKGFKMTTILIPDDVEIYTFEVKKLPLGWNVFPELNETQLIGDFFIQQMKHVVMKVPSAVVKGDFNYLLNPFHADFNKIIIASQEDFPFDKRIFK